VEDGNGRIEIKIRDFTERINIKNEVYEFS
jgi:hypothetical protein